MRRRGLVLLVILTCVTAAASEPGAPDAPSYHSAVALARAGDSDRALREAGAIADSEMRWNALCRIVGLRAETDLGGAMALASQLRTVAGELPASVDLGLGWKHVAHARARVGDLPGALAASGRLDAWHRVRSLELIVEAFVGRGELSRAQDVLDVAERLDGADAALDRVHETIARAAGARRDMDLAHEHADAIGDSRLRGETLGHLVALHVGTGALEEALSVARRIENERERDEALSAVSRAQAERRAHALALNTADLISRREDLERAYEAVMVSIIAEGDLHGAMGVAARSGNADGQARLLVRLSHLLLEAGDHSSALVAARACAELDVARQVRASCAIAADLARVGDRDLADAVLAEAWSAAVEHLGEVDCATPAPFERVDGLQEVLRVVVKAAGLDAAVAMAEALPEECLQDAALQLVEWSLRESGRIADADRIREDHPELGDRWSALQAAEQLRRELGALRYERIEPIVVESLRSRSRP